MKKKLLVIVVCMLMIASTTILITPENLRVKAAGGGSGGGSENGVGVNTSFIHSITEDLSYIVKTYQKGRSFGTPGEWRAANNISQWMNQIGLYNVHTEEITGTDQHPELNATLEILSMGIKINGTQTITDCFVSPRWNLSFIRPNFNYNTLTYNCSENDTLPIYRKLSWHWWDLLFDDRDFLYNLSENITVGNITDFKSFIYYCLNSFAKKFSFTYEDYDESDPKTYPSFYNGIISEPSNCGPFLYIDEDFSFNPNVSFPSGLDDYETLSLPRVWYNTGKLLSQMMLCLPRCKGLILYDFNNDTYDMTNGLDMPVPILHINRSVGRPIYENATNTTPSNRNISFWINQRYNDIKSYNVIGQINGTDPNKTVLIDCLYDCWWNQGTGDAAIGMGTVLALGKYFKELKEYNNITPKYTLKFVAFGGEEYGFLGAQHYSDSHTTENITTMIDLNQIGFSQTGPLPQTLFIHLNNASLIPLIGCITNDTHYEERTGVPFLHIGYTYYGAPSDDGPFAVAYYKGDRSLNTICFLKDMNWTLHHRDGRDHTLGDVMDYYNETDVNVTAEMVWNITKYFTVDPDCHFHTVSYEATNAKGGVVPDTIKATFNVKSVLPSDLVMINASFYSTSSGEPLDNIKMNFTTNRIGVERNIMFTMPAGAKEGDYYVTLEVYNSTARINGIVGVDFGANDTGTSPIFHLNKYRTLGDIRIGTVTANVHNIIWGSQFNTTEDAVVHNITAYVYGTQVQYPPPSYPTYQCMIYCISNGTLIGYSEPIACYETGWVMFNFSTQPFLIQDTQYMLTIWGDNENAIVYSTPMSYSNAYCNASYTFGTPPTTIEWDLNLSLQQFSVFCWYTPDIPQITSVYANPHTVGFGCNVTISADVTDRGGVNLVKAQIHAPGSGVGMSNYTMTHVSGDTYQYVFSDTWNVGQYNYSIWTVDNSSNENRSTGYHFHVSADATISIATLKDSYNGNQFINITDPPNPPENLTVVGRGLTWDEYYNAITGQNILEVSNGPINYKEDNGAWTPINNTMSQLAANHPAYV